MSSLEHFTVKCYLQDKSVSQRGHDHINIISVAQGSKPPAFFLLGAHTWDASQRSLLGINTLCNHWSSLQPWFCSCAVFFNRHSLGKYFFFIFLSFSREKSLKSYTVPGFALGTMTCRINVDALFSFYRTVNNFLMAGPKVNTCCCFCQPVYIINTDINNGNDNVLFPPHPRPIWPTLTVCKWAHGMGYKSVNASSLWRNGTVQRTRFPYPHIAACGVVRTQSLHTSVSRAFLAALLMRLCAKYLLRTDFECIYYALLVPKWISK